MMTWAQMTTRKGDDWLIPTTDDEMARCLADPEWRLFSGYLYKIITKGDKDKDKDKDKEGLVLPFIPNRAQRRFIRRLWHRNLILKARQLGFTTLICILWLDTALFVENIRCGIIAQDREAAESLFRDKVKFAYDQLPDALRQMMPLRANNASTLVFGHNNSSIRVATSMRSGTIHRLHISEFGKICAKYPDKAVEVITGSIPAVPSSGILIIESTAEGRDGAFYKMTQASMAAAESGKKLTVKDYRFHFFPWWQEPGYQIDPAGVVLTDADHEYFSQVEGITGTTLTNRQQSWYVATRDSEFSGEDEKMWQEYPSYPEEAFQVSTEGCYFSKQLAAARKENRIKPTLQLLPNIPCHTYWDIGNSDGTAIWVTQRLGGENRVIRFYEAWGEPYSHAAQWLQGLGVIFGTHHLPHDADHVRQGQSRNISPREMLEELMPGQRFATVDRIQDVNWGIQQTRDIFPTLVFDEPHCKAGLIHIAAYRKKWNDRMGCWSDEPDKAGGHSEAADALRQLGQTAHADAKREAGSGTQKRRLANWRRT